AASAAVPLHRPRSAEGQDGPGLHGDDAVLPRPEPDGKVRAKPPGVHDAQGSARAAATLRAVSMSRVVLLALILLLPAALPSSPHPQGSSPSLSPTTGATAAADDDEYAPPDLPLGSGDEAPATT